MLYLINLVIISCVLSFGYCLIHISEINLYTTPLLPFTFLFLTIFFNKIYKSYNSSFVFKLFIFQATIRYCIFPVIVSTDQNFISNYSLFYLNVAIFVMILELVFVFVVFVFFSKKQKNSFLNKKSSVIPLRGSFFLLIFLAILFYYAYSSGAFSQISLIWNLSDYVEDYITNNTEVNSSGFGLVFFNLFKSLLALLFISFVYGFNKTKDSVKKWLYLLIILTSGAFIIGTSRFSFILFMLPLLFLISYILNKKEYEKIFKITSILLVVALVITTIAKFTRYENTVSAENFLSASSINAYFAGIGNIAIGLNAYEKVDFSKSLFFLINDTFQNVPLLSKITLEQYKTTLRFNEEIYGHTLYADQIVPLSISGLFHFGFIGMIFYSSFFISIALLFERLSYKSNFIAYKYLFIYLSVNTSLVYMLNIGSFYSSMAGAFIFLLLPFYSIKYIQRLKLG